MKLLLIFCRNEYSYKWDNEFFIRITYKTLFNKKYILRQEKIGLFQGMVSIANNIAALTESILEGKKTKENIYLN